MMPKRRFLTKPSETHHQNYPKPLFQRVAARLLADFRIVLAIVESFGAWNDKSTQFPDFNNSEQINLSLPDFRLFAQKTNTQLLLSLQPKRPQNGQSSS